MILSLFDKLCKKKPDDFKYLHLQQGSGFLILG